MQQADKTKPMTLEQRLEPWIEQGEYIIVLVIMLMAWAGGWVNLIAFESWNPVIFGRYSPSFFALMVVYTALFGVWFWLMGSLKALEQMKRGIAFLQRTPLLYCAIWAAFILVLWSMTALQIWLSFPLLQVTLLLGMGLFTALVMLAKPTAEAPFQRWRKAALLALTALVVLEISLQAMAYAGVYPVTLDDGVEVSYGHIYQTEETLVNDFTNQYGWFYPEFRLEDGSERIILLGDTFVQALQVPKTAHMGVQLEALLNEGVTDNPETEVIAHGMSGYGAYNYLNNLYWPIIWEPVAPDAFVVFVQPANDLDLWLEAEMPPSDVSVDGMGIPYLIQPTVSFSAWHRLAHQVTSSYDPINPLLVLYHRSLTWNLLNTWLGNNSISYERELPTADSTEAAPFGTATFLYDGTESGRAERTYAEFAQQLELFAGFMAEQGIAVHLVTIPYFPEAFYAQASGEDWQATWGDYDLLAPEAQVITLADELGLPSLALGQHWQATASVDDLQSYFTNDGTGRFSVAGHGAVSEVLHACFFKQAEPAACTTN